VSEADLETIRRVYDLWNGPDGMRAALPFLDADIEYVNPESALEPGIRRGHAGMIEVLQAVEGPFVDYVHELERLVDAGDKVMAYVTFRARGRDSGAVVEKPEQHVWTVREGKVVRFEWFHDEPAARLAAGL
jgi:ketosteroid isomerase-like protein